ncbi:MAG: glycosyltransferase involved in cell wall biosynthesis [bacterium]|jgi:glycosyltransferase involved in cell wall biosynthesis
MKPKVTVLTCVYNGLPYLKEAIESTLNQTYSNFEYLIIDDCSPDKEVVQFIKSYDDPRIRFVQNDVNLGVSETMNKAFAMIETPYVVRIDQDDVNLPTRVEEQIAYLESHPNVDIVCSWEHTINSQGKILGDWKRKLDNYGEFLGYILIGICPIWHPSIAFRTQSMIEVGGFNHDYVRAEDFEVTARLALKRYSAAVIQKFHLLQREHDNRQSIEFADKQVEVTQRIHNKAIEAFLPHPEAKILASFLRLENDPIGGKKNKASIKKIDVLLKEMFFQIKEKQKLSDDELQSLKKIIFNRVGVGIKHTPFLSRLPSFLFLPSYYLLSPQQIQSIRKYAATFYQKVVRQRYFFK